MNTIVEASPHPGAPTTRRRATPELPLWRLYGLRAGYLLIAVGLAVYKWPAIIHHATPWPLMEGVVDCMLAALSLLALLGVRYPVRMLPLLLWESAWKLIWLGIVAAPQWTAHTMDAATRETARSCVLVVIILAVIPWRYVVTQYGFRPGDRWR
jgi:hypothetical protein